MIEEKLIFEVLSAVDEIPLRKVATYGQIARLIGREKTARLVGKILRMSQQYGEYPCHRKEISVESLTQGIRQRLDKVQITALI